MEKRRIGFQVDALLAPEQAIASYLERAQLRAPRIELVPIERAAGRILAQRAIADRDYPSAPRSAMDGFALRSADTPGRLRLAGEVRMGARAQTLATATALRIPTGGVVPRGADAVLPIEDAELVAQEVLVGDRVRAGDCITPAGSDTPAGEVLLEPGHPIGGRELGALALLGIADVPVFARPRVAVISSGDELVDIRAEPGDGQVRDSNRWAVAGTLRGMGAEPVHLPVAPDDPGALEALLREALQACEAAVVIGGSSVGDRDFTPRVVERLGRPGVIVHGLRVKPGKPTVLGAIDGKPVIGLPGNPASALLIADAVAAPIVAVLCGGAPKRHSLPARLAEPCRKRPGWTWYVPVRLDEAAEGLQARPLELRSSSVSVLARADGYVVADGALDVLDAGTPVRVMRFIGS